MIQQFLIRNRLFFLFDLLWNGSVGRFLPVLAAQKQQTGKVEEWNELRKRSVSSRK